MSLPSAKGEATRFAFRGVARNDKDLAASLVFTKLLQARLRALLRVRDEVVVENRYNTLPGSVVITLPATLGQKQGREAVLKAVADAASAAEFQAALSEARDRWHQNDVVSYWLDADTYKIADPYADARILDKVTASDVNAYALKVRDLPLVSIAISARQN